MLGHKVRPSDRRPICAGDDIRRPARGTWMRWGSKSPASDVFLARGLTMRVSPLRWTSKSSRYLAAALCAMGHCIGHDRVGALLKTLGYSFHGNRKAREGAHHADRDARFQHIAQTVQAAITAGQPAISVDTRKKELVGDFKNGGREYRPTGSPEPVRVQDFIDPELGRAAPYGVHDSGDDKGWVSVGIDHDTAAFAVNAIRSWWMAMGRSRYRRAHTLTITADGGGGSRVRLWKLELQRLADDLGLTIVVLHLPPGTSKWNKIEHRLLSFISRNWRGGRSSTIAPSSNSSERRPRPPG